MFIRRRGRGQNGADVVYRCLSWLGQEHHSSTRDTPTRLHISQRQFITGMPSIPPYRPTYPQDYYSLYIVKRFLPYRIFNILQPYLLYLYIYSKR